MISFTMRRFTITVGFVIMVLLTGIVVQARTIKVGTGQTCATPSAASSAVQNGDTVEIAKGTYADQETQWSANNLTLRGTSTYAHCIAPAVISNQKAIWVIQGKNTIVENIEFSNASVPDQNGAGIRQEGDTLTIRNCYFHDNEDGILGGGSVASTVTIENTEFYNNGFGDGYSHNLYISHIAKFTLRFCNTHHAKIGHDVKSRANENYILYNRIMDEADGTASYEIDLPNGGTSYIIGNLIQQGPQTDNSTIIAYGEEGLSNTASNLYLVNNTIVNDRSGGTFVSIPSTAQHAKIINNLFVGTGTIISGPADTTTNCSTSSPGFVNRTTYDYHLTALSPAIDRGSNPGSANGYALAAVYQYAANCSSQVRPQQGSLDIGAYEYSNTSIKRSRAESNTFALYWTMVHNPINAALFNRYLQNHRNTIIYNCIGMRINGSQVGLQGTYMLKNNETNVVQKVCVIK